MKGFRVFAIINPMKVVLIQDIKNLGRRGDIKEVAEGYARNFLFTRKLAEPATETAIREAQIEKQKLIEKEQTDLEKTQELATQLEGKEIIITAKEKDGKLFGSVQAKDLVKELKKEAIILDDKAILLDSPIKEIGEYEIKIALEHGIEASIRVVVESC